GAARGKPPPGRGVGRDGADVLGGVLHPAKAFGGDAVVGAAGAPRDLSSPASLADLQPSPDSGAARWRRLAAYGCLLSPNCALLSSVTTMGAGVAFDRRVLHGCEHPFGRQVLERARRRVEGKDSRSTLISANNKKSTTEDTEEHGGRRIHCYRDERLFGFRRMVVDKQRKS